jgi:hypothetical protein
LGFLFVGSGAEGGLHLSFILNATEKPNGSGKTRQGTTSVEPIKPIKLMLGFSP